MTEQTNQLNDTSATNSADSEDKLLKRFKFTLILFLSLPVALFFAVFLPLLLLIYAIVLLVTCAGNAVMAIKAIWKNDPRCKKFAKCSLFLQPSFFLAYFLIITGGMALSFSSAWGGGHSHLRKPLFEYAEKHDGQFPDPNIWCDALIESEVNGEIDNCYLDSDWKDCRSALNVHAAELGSKMPGDMVLLISSGDSWNKFGSRELVDDPNIYGAGIAVTFADGTNDYLPRERARYLKWQIGDDGIYPRPNTAWAVAGISILLILLTVLIMRRFRTTLSSAGSVLVVIPFLSLAAGFLFGTLAETMYLVDDGAITGSVAGAGIGLLAGLCYVAIVAAKTAGRPYDPRIGGPLTLIAVICGIVTSSLVHLLIMIVKYEFGYSNIIAGAGFGVYAGTVLAALTWWMLSPGKEQPIHHNEPTAAEENA